MLFGHCFNNWFGFLFALKFLLEIVRLLWIGEKFSILSLKLQSHVEIF